MTRRALVAAMVGSISLAVVCLTVLQADAKNSTPSGVTVKTLAQGPVKALPPGKILINILEFRQLPGGDYGPHSHPPAIVYTLHGVASFSFPGGSTRSVGAGHAVFFPAVVYSHQNLDGRFGAGAIAAGLVVAVLLLCAATWMRGPTRQITVAILSLALIVGGALPLIGATANDYYLFAVRGYNPNVPVPMPRPDAHIAYSSSDLTPIPAGPYIETLSAITLPTGAHYDAPAAQGPQIVIVVAGTATVHVGDETRQLATGDTALAQMGQTLSIVNAGSGSLQVLRFAVTSVSALPGAA